jgi:mannosyl-oligosaccharide alpha-1,2-mannosidase
MAAFSVFETTIRYIGGLLSAYELSGSAYPALVTKAKQVADKLTAAWVGVSVCIVSMSYFSS